VRQLRGARVLVPSGERDQGATETALAPEFPSLSGDSCAPAEPAGAKNWRLLENLIAQPPNPCPAREHQLPEQAGEFACAQE
jgi:hypothetical protein